MPVKKRGDRSRKKFCKDCDDMTEHHRKVKYELFEGRRLYSIYDCTICGCKFSMEESV
jgi:hypothetical protein